MATMRGGEGDDGTLLPKREKVEDDGGDLKAEEEDDYVPYVPLRQRKKDKEEKRQARRRHQQQMEEERRRRKEREQAAPQVGPQAKQTLVQFHGKSMQEGRIIEQSDLEKQLTQEQEILRSIRNAKELKSVEELAKGISYAEPIRTSWRPPRHVRHRTEQKNERIRKKWNIIVEGRDCAPAVTNFRDMKLPTCLVDYLDSQGIKTPTPIQMQGLPVALSGRDMIGIAFTGSGKTLCFSLPAIMLTMEQEIKMPFQRGEGPYACVLCPSRELARQTFDAVKEYAGVLHKGGMPKLNIVLCMGGVDMREQLYECHNIVHIAVCTPGRLIDMLTKKKFTFNVCRYFCMDEADRMVDLGFEEDIRTIFSFFNGQRQTVLFSATMPTKIRDFAQSALVDPITVNVGRAGAASLDVVQEVEHVRPEAKIVYLLECLQKTPPPVMIFSEKKADVDDIHEYLLLKGVQAVAIHGGKDQEERDMAVKAFKKGQKDVLVATDIASKGLDFKGIQHVINFDMPDELENYVHRIGRTGRSGRTGLATTFINDEVPEISLLDLKYLLKEAKQRVPPFLQNLRSEHEKFLEHGGCAYCGGPGHRITSCPKLESVQSQQVSRVGRGDGLAGGDES
ncbi:DEAD box polypeptide 41 [Salpingoeca rosetta]|uniref:RNA helicase n=1 Tax=Salpingoeca rosetta (strain ATCC 50818 / BSB-021) TaxID=946362 RepID=F2TWY2_SALR5|nr:DEAD box polypeptide 41 [Salpingoeca rosetta]EGD75891.1 DEAD box polypeptide 41 [Salpingoeca rosetta]|eukprot:XP_004998067.1 DEAD box polypeptide 41 [Salpingoeca rosetta]